eukprot:2460-Pelagococcus_subviridis.AAC.2
MFHAVFAATERSSRSGTHSSNRSSSSSSSSSGRRLSLGGVLMNDPLSPRPPPSSASSASSCLESSSNIASSAPAGGGVRDMPTDARSRASQRSRRRRGTRPPRGRGVAAVLSTIHVPDDSRSTDATGGREL